MSFTSTLVDIPQPCRLAHHSRAVLGNHIVLCGGYCEDSKSLKQNYLFLLETNPISVPFPQNYVMLATFQLYVILNFILNFMYLVVRITTMYDVWELSSSNNPEAVNAIDDDDDDIAVIGYTR